MTSGDTVTVYEIDVTCHIFMTSVVLLSLFKKEPVMSPVTINPQKEPFYSQAHSVFALTSVDTVADAIFTLPDKDGGANIRQHIERKWGPCCYRVPGATDY
jgi:hypothetical protein